METINGSWSALAVAHSAMYDNVEMIKYKADHCHCGDNEMLS